MTRTPLRISLGGGGSDVPSYYRERGRGFLVAAAIDKHVYISVHENFDDNLLLKYSRVERVADPVEVNHPIIRSALMRSGLSAGMEITSFADIPAGTGLGSSGSFTVGLVRALREMERLDVSPEVLAKLACQIELEDLGEPIGKQDQYIAAYGGVTSFEFRGDESVVVSQVDLARDTLFGLEEGLLLFYTGVRRSASEQLSGLVSSSAGVLTSLDESVQIGENIHRALETGDLDYFGTLLTRQWALKRDRSPSPFHSDVDVIIEAGLNSGALGGKLVGAGGGGFLLFFTDRKVELREEMSSRGLQEVPLRFDFSGSLTLQW